MKGRVKRFSDLRGYGFVTGEDGQDYFLHYTRIAGEGFKSVNPGDRVTFTPKSTEKGLQAYDVGKWIETPEQVYVDISGQSIDPPKPQLKLKINPFTPQDPITDPNKFAGRVDVLANAIDCLFNNKNLLVIGARGIGKSSFAYQLINLTKGDRTIIDRIGFDTCGFKFKHVTADHRCLPGQSLDTLAKSLLASLISKDGAFRQKTASKKKTELDLKVLKISEEAEEKLVTNELALDFSFAIENYFDQTPEPITGLCFLIDEIDVLDKDVEIAPFIKSVIEKLRLDGYKNISFILSGVTGTITDFIAQHPSSLRLIENIEIEPMKHEELISVIDNALEGTECNITPKAKDRIIRLSDRFPSPVHLLGYHSFRLDEDDNIDEADVNRAMDFIIQNLKRQEFEGRLEKIGGGLAEKIIRSLADSEDGLHVDKIANRLMETSHRIHGVAANLVKDGYLKRTSNGYKVAEPLFHIYLKWLFQSS